MIGPTYLRARDPLGLLTWEFTADTRPELRTYPREEVLRRVLAPAETQVFTGNEVARVKGEGIEFADIRPWTSGDPLKRVNWRASARRGDLWVNESHPERNTDVILFVDSFAEARRGDESTLDLAVRATATLADAYVRRRDRVGLVAFGGILRWLVPGTGLVQLYRIIDALLDTQIFLSYYWKEIDVIPRRTLAAERARGRAVAPARPPLGRRALNLQRPRLRPGGRRHLPGARSRSAQPAGSTPSRTTSGGCDETPCATGSNAPESPSSNGTQARRCRPFSRRCGHSGATPGTRAPDHRRSARSARSQEQAATEPSAGRRSTTPPPDGLFAAWRCSPVGLVLRWPATIPWAVVLPGRLCRRPAHGTSLVDPWAAVVGVLLLVSAELASWSIDHDAGSGRSLRSCPSRVYPARRSPPRRCCSTSSFSRPLRSRLRPAC